MSTEKTTLSLAMKEALELRIVTFYERATEDGSYSVDDLITRIARFAIRDPRDVKDEFEERFDGKPLAPCRLTWDDGQNESTGVVDLDSGKIFWDDSSLDLSEVGDLMLSFTESTQPGEFEKVLFPCEESDYLSSDEDELEDIARQFRLFNPLAVTLKAVEANTPEKPNGNDYLLYAHFG